MLISAELYPRTIDARTREIEIARKVEREESDLCRRMLAVFDKSVAKSPEGLKSPASGGEENAVHGVEALLQHFSLAKEGLVNISLGSSGALAYSTEKKNPFLPL